MKAEYAIIVKNKTRLELLIERFNTRSQARFYMDSHGGDFADYELEHDTFHQSLEELQKQLSRVIKYKIIERNFVPSYLFSKKNIVIVIGQDGLVANTAKYANGVPIIAVNPDVRRYDGVLLPYTTDNFIAGVENALSDNIKRQIVRFAEAKLNDGQRLLAFNDLFIGTSSHVSARYQLRFGQAEEQQSSSGIIVSTKAGATGWLSSIFNMAYGVAGVFEPGLQKKMPTLDDNTLFFTVREPFISKYSAAGTISGFINDQKTLLIKSLMPTNGVIFSDGIESDFLHFNSGSIAEIGIAKEQANLVIAK